MTLQFIAGITWRVVDGKRIVYASLDRKMASAVYDSIAGFDAETRCKTAEEYVTKKLDPAYAETCGLSA